MELYDKEKREQLLLRLKEVMLDEIIGFTAWSKRLGLSKQTLTYLLTDPERTGTINTIMKLDRYFRKQDAIAKRSHEDNA